MFSTARTTRTQQQAHHKHPSIIRTRSQQPHPLSPADLSASPLKEAIRSRKQHYTHTHNHVHISKPHTLDETKYEEHRTPLVDFAIDDPNKTSPSRRKRASSPSFITDHDAKRARVLGESTRANTLCGRHSKVSPITEHSEAAPPEDVFQSLEREVPPGSSANVLDGGSTMKGPLLPGKELDRHKDKTEAVQVILRDPSGFTDVLEGPSSISTENHLSAAQNAPPPFDQNHLLRPLHSNDTNTHVPPSTPTSFPSGSRSILRRRLGDGLLFGDSPITPLPALFHATGRNIPPKISHSPSGKEKSAESSHSPAPPISLQSDRPRQSSPTKSRIPVPAGTSTSRFPRPSSLFLSGTIKNNSSNPMRDSRHRPKSKQKMYRKPKADLRSRPPTTRLAVKRGIRRMSSAATGLRKSSTSTGANIPLRDSAGSSKSESMETTSKIDKKRPFFTSSRTSSENMANARTSSLFPHTASSSGSPMRPTPLSALSTALQKLLVTPPAAPVRRPRPNASPSFTGDDNASELAQSQNDDTETVFEAPKTPSTENKFQRHEVSIAHSRLSGTPQGIGKIGLPMRRPGSMMDAGKSATSSNALFIRKRTNLSTVPASPVPDAVVLVDCDASSSSRAAQHDTRISPHVNVEGERREKGGIMEFTVPLVDESHPRRPPAPELVSPSRRASHASLSLTQSLTFPRAPPGLPLARSTSASSGLKFNPRSPVKTRGRTKPPPPPESDTTTKDKDPMNGKRSNARMPGSLDVLKDCVIFVDVKTEEGEEAGALFVDMLRGLGARILLKPGKSCTHLIYKDGSPATLTKYKLLPEPRPLLVSIGWVVECVEKREHVDETRFLVELDELGGVGSAQRRRSMQPKQMRTMTIGQFDSGQSADISVRADSSFTSEEQSTSGPILATLSPATRILHGSLPPLERARQRSLHLSHKP